MSLYLRAGATLEEVMSYQVMNQNTGHIKVLGSVGRVLIAYDVRDRETPAAYKTDKQDGLEKTCTACQT